MRPDQQNPTQMIISLLQTVNTNHRYQIEHRKHDQDQTKCIQYFEKPRCLLLPDQTDQKKGVKGLLQTVNIKHRYLIEHRK